MNAVLMESAVMVASEGMWNVNGVDVECTRKSKYCTRVMMSSILWRSPCCVAPFGLRVWSVLDWDKVALLLEIFGGRLYL